jgi:carboxypeptidase Taq
MTAYQNLKDRFAQIENLDSAVSILSKDMQTIMAPGSADDRVNQMVAVENAIHSLMSDPRVEEWLNEAESAASSFPADDQRNLSLMRQKWIHAASLPSDLAHEKSRISSEGMRMHGEHYKSGSWAAVKEGYAASFKMAREVGQAKQAALGVDSVYDALLDEFSPGLRNADIQREFSALDRELRIIIPQAEEFQNGQPQPLPISGPFDLKAQMAMSTEIARLIGFDFNRGVLQMIDGHPSSGGSSDDSRITTRGDETNFIESLFATAHEVGHGMYEQNQPVAWRYQPAGSHLGMSVHESQSMVIELQACMSREFLNFLAERLQETFNRKSDPAFTGENLRRSMWRTQSSLIRVMADELTYPMHILLRHDLESKIVKGEIDVKDLPDAWNDGMQQRLGIIPANHAQGCMQDVHWPTGMIGYFPAYTLGAMGAAQFFNAARKNDPSILPQLEKGNFKPLTSWLRENVHSKGALVDMNALYTQATGESLNSKAYLNHFRHRYLGKPAL